MARDHARIQVAIWDDPDFTQLTAVQQQVYLALTSSKDLSYAGVHPLVPGRLTRNAADLTKAKVMAAFGVLAARRFILMDQRTEEIAVRTYVRHDGIVKQPNMLKACLSAIQAVRSDDLREAILHELGKALHGAFPKGLPDSIRKALAYAFPEGFPEGLANSLTPYPLPQLRTASAVRATPPESSPETPPPPPPPPPAGNAIEQPDPETAHALVAEWLDHTTTRPPSRVIGQVAKELKLLLDEGQPPDDVRAGLAAWARKGLHPSTLASVVHETRTPKPARNGTAIANPSGVDWDAAFARAAQRDQDQR